MSTRRHDDRHHLRGTARGTARGRDDRHQHLRPQLRRPLRGQRACASTTASCDLHRSARRWQPELPPLHACARGFGQIERAYHPDRLQYPLRRVGPRGSRPVRAHLLGRGAGRGRARDAARARDLRQRRHPRLPRAPAACRCCTAAASAQRFLYMFGGCTELWSNMSAEAEVFAVRMTYGAKADYKSAGREPTDYVNSKLILMWGWSPGDGTFGTGTLPVSEGRRRSRACASSASIRAGRVTSRQLADEHIFIQPVDRRRRADRDGLRDRERGPARPGLSATATCWASTRRTCRRARRPARPIVSYLLGETRRRARRRRNGPRRSPASRPRRIRRLAIEFATTKPAALQCGYAPGRTALRRAVPPRRLRARRDHRQCRHRRAATPASATAPPAARASRACRPGTNPIDARGRVAAAGRPARARQGGRLSRPTSS